MNIIKYPSEDAVRAAMAADRHYEPDRRSYGASYTPDENRL